MQLFDFYEICTTEIPFEEKCYYGTYMYLIAQFIDRGNIDRLALFRYLTGIY